MLSLSTRECISHTRQTTTQFLRVDLDLPLWQDLRRPGGDCWAERFRWGRQQLNDEEATNARKLFQRFVYSMQPAPPRHWRVADVIDAIGRERCADLLLHCLDRPSTNPPTLTAAGSVVLKNVVWVAELLQCPALDRTLHHAAFLPWKKRQPIEKVAVALAWMWSRREDRDVAFVKLTELRRSFGDGIQIPRLLTQVSK